MNLNTDLFLSKNYITRKRPKINLEVFTNTQKISNIDSIKNRYSKKSKDYFLEKIKSINNGRIVNNILTPSEKSYLTEINQSQISRDIYGYNNYIINKNSFNTINFSSKKNTDPKTFNVSNFSYSDTPNYLTEYDSSSNIRSNNIINTNKYLTTNNFNNNTYNNNDIRFMNMKLNFKLLQQKLTYLNDIAISNEKDPLKTPYKIPNYSNNISGNNNKLFTDEYPIKVFRSANINANDKKKKFLKVRKNNEESLYKKMNAKMNLMKNLNIIKNNSLEGKNKEKDSNFNLNIRNENELFKNKIKNKNEKQFRKKTYFTNENSLKIHYFKEENELSQIADNILEMNKSLENTQNNYYIKDKLFDIKDIKPKENNNNIKNQKLKNNYRFISNEIEDISLNKGFINQNQSNNKKNIKLIAEHIFSYNSTENKKALTQDNSDIFKLNKKKETNKNINIVQTNNFIINNLTEKNKNNREERINKDFNNTDINFKKQKNNNIIINEQNFEDDNNNEEDDGDKIINSLIATASQNFKNENKNDNISIQITDFNNHLKNDKKKAVTFDDNLVYINYYQDYKVTNLHITDSNDNTILYKPKNISKYLKNLTSSSDNLKPIIINSNKPNYFNIINKIKIKNTNGKINKINTNKTIKKNIDFIKEVKKRNNSKERSQSKDKYKNKINTKNNQISIKVDQINSRPIKDKKVLKKKK